MWFSYDFEGDGFVTYETEAAMTAAVKKILDGLRETSFTDGWPEDIEGIMYGKVTHKVMQVMCKKRPDDLDEDETDDEGTYFGHWDEVADYDLRPVDQPAPDVTKTVGDGDGKERRMMKANAQDRGPYKYHQTEHLESPGCSCGTPCQPVDRKEG